MLFIEILDIFGTFVFAISGAFRAVKYELDLLGVTVLAVSTGVGGGIIRDIMLGQNPPLAIADQKYVITCIIAALCSFVATNRIARRWNIVMYADAIGLGVFAAIGASKAAAAGMGPVGVMLMAALTATGGGVIRDILVSEIPAILTSDFYASAALLGGASFLIVQSFTDNQVARLMACTIITIVIRFLAMHYKISLPKVKSLPASPSQMTKERKSK